MKVMSNQFTKGIDNGFKTYGLEVKATEVGVTSSLFRLKLHDLFHESETIGLAISNPAGEDFNSDWNTIISNDLIPLLYECKRVDMMTPVALIVPSSDLTKLVAYLKLLNIEVNVYQLFQGYSVAGIKKSYIEKFYNNFMNEKAKLSDTVDEVPLINEKSLKTIIAKTLTINYQQSKHLSDIVKNNKVISMPDLMKGANPSVSDNNESNVNNDSTDNNSNKRMASISKINNFAHLYKKIAVASLVGITIALLASVLKVLYFSNVTVTEPAIIISAKTANKELYRGFKFFKEPNTNLLKVLAKNEKISGKYLNKLAETDLWINVVENPKSNADFILYASNHDLESVRISAASNPSTPSTILNKLAFDKSVNVRMAVAKNPSTAGSVLNALAVDVNGVKENLLENINLTPKLLKSITDSTTPTCSFNRKLMANPLTPLNTIMYNENNPDDCVREGIALNQITPSDIVERLSKDPSQKVRSAALISDKISNARLNQIFIDDSVFLNRDGHDTDMMAAILNPNIKQNILEKAVIINPTIFNSVVINNPAISESLLSDIKMHAQGSGGVNQFLLLSKDIPADTEILGRIAQSVLSGKSTILTALKKELNIIFAETIYDPYVLTDYMLRYVNLKDKNDVSRSSSFSDDIDISIVDNDNLDYTPTNFTDQTDILTYILSKNNGEKITKVALNAADNIVYEMLIIMLPKVEIALVNSKLVDKEYTDNYAKPEEDSYLSSDEVFFQNSYRMIDQVNNFFDEV